MILVWMLYPEITNSLPNPALSQIFLILDTKQEFSGSIQTPFSQTRSLNFDFNLQPTLVEVGLN